MKGKRARKALVCGLKQIRGTNRCVNAERESVKRGEREKESEKESE